MGPVVRASVRAGGAALLLLLGAASACRFERRPDLTADEPVTATLYRPPDYPTTPVEDSVRGTVVAVTEAFAVGDGARVAQLTTREAILIDQEDEVRWTRAGGSPLPRPLPSAERGLSWRMEGSSFALLSDGVALYSCLFTASVTAEEVPWSAVESWILVRTEGGMAGAIPAPKPGARTEHAAAVSGEGLTLADVQTARIADAVVQTPCPLSLATST